MLKVLDSPTFGTGEENHQDNFKLQNQEFSRKGKKL